MRDKEEVKKIYRDSRRIIYAHSRNEAMSPTERRENIEIEEDHFAKQICQLESKPDGGISCPFCNNWHDCDKEGLKHHLTYCEVYKEVENV